MTTNIPPKVLELARKIAADTVAKVDCPLRDKYLDGRCDHSHAVKSALTAIMEVTERAIERVMKCDFDDEGDFIVSALRNWEHLKQ